MADNRGLLSLDPRGHGLPESLASDIELIDRLFCEVLREKGGEQLIQLARTLYDSLPDESAVNLLHTMPELGKPRMVQLVMRAFTVLFQLLNTVEQKEIIRVNRERQAHRTGQPRPESLAEAVHRLKEQKVSAAAVQDILNNVDIRPTLTAHPTEARRRAVLDKLQRIAELLVQRIQPPEIPHLDRPLDSVGIADREIRRVLTALWETDELRAKTVTVDDEVSNGLYYFERTIMRVVPWLHADLRRALAECYPDHDFEIPPFLRYHSWIGGDRDGNPNVTAEVTWRTLLKHKRTMLGHFIQEVRELQRDLTLSSRVVHATRDLQASIAADIEMTGFDPDRIERYAKEPYVLKLALIEARLAATLGHLDALRDFMAEGPSFVASAPAYRDSTQFVDDLELIQRSLEKGGAKVLAREGRFSDVLIQARTFGFHLASLDIREHSERHEVAVEALFEAAGVLPRGKKYRQLTEEQKVKALTKELCQSRPLLPRDWVPPDEVRDILRVFEVLRHGRRYISAHSVTAYVISMTHGVSDVLEVLLLAKEEGLVRWRKNGSATVLESDLDVVPLFETIEDLEACDRLVTQMFGNAAYKQVLESRGKYQEIMLGYSDSSKDGGYLAANWALQDTQDRLAKACRKAGLTMRLFHGRGGTVGRGGGRANRAIMSQPAGSFTGQIRFTEQGEVVSFRYGLAPLAHRHLEQIASAVIICYSEHSRHKGSPAHWNKAMTVMARQSLKVYRKTVHEDPEFWKFYTAATPIGHISRLPIASRPVSRASGAMVGLDQLRAIPWVFAWVQCRYVLPGWFGIGSALKWFVARDKGNEGLLREMYGDWPFFRTVIDNAQFEILRAHLPTAAMYAGRVTPKRLGQRFHQILEAEYNLTRDWLLVVTGQTKLREKSPLMRQIIDLRNPVLVPLSKLQVALLEDWDKHPDRSEAEKSDWREAILLSIAGIAAAMQSTG